MIDDEESGVRSLPPLPFEIQFLVDDLVGRWDGVNPLADDPALRELTEWMAAHNDEIGLLDDEPISTPIIPEAETANLSDELLLEARDDADDLIIDDDARVAFATAHFRDLLTGELVPDTDYHPACGLFQISATGGVSALLAFGSRGHSFGGVDVDWYGLFDSQDDFVRHQRGLGWLFDLEDLAGMPRARTLALWDRSGLD